MIELFEASRRKMSTRTTRGVGTSFVPFLENVIFYESCFVWRMLSVVVRYECEDKNGHKNSIYTHIPSHTTRKYMRYEESRFCAAKGIRMHFSS